MEPAIERPRQERDHVPAMISVYELTRKTRIIVDEFLPPLVHGQRRAGLRQVQYDRERHILCDDAGQTLQLFGREWHNTPSLIHERPLSRAFTP